MVIKQKICPVLGNQRNTFIYCLGQHITLIKLLVVLVINRNFKSILHIFGKYPVLHVKIVSRSLVVTSTRADYLVVSFPIFGIEHSSDVIDFSGRYFSRIMFTQILSILQVSLSYLSATKFDLDQVSLFTST